MEELKLIGSKALNEYCIWVKSKIDNTNNIEILNNISPKILGNIFYDDVDTLLKDL